VPDERTLHERLVDWTREAWHRGSLRAPAADQWDDPFEGYGPAPDELDLTSLREAARAPLTPISGGSNGHGGDNAEHVGSRPHADR